MPPASGELPEIKGITITGSQDHNSCDAWDFKVNRDEEIVAIHSLVDSLDIVSKFSLADHSRGDYESCSTYQKKCDQYERNIGGHGWSGDRIFMDKEALVKDALDKVKYNYGNDNHNFGKITNYKM